MAENSRRTDVKVSVMKYFDVRASNGAGAHGYEEPFGFALRLRNFLEDEPLDLFKYGGFHDLRLLSPSPREAWVKIFSKIPESRLTIR